jgi:hypothetical protein
MNNQELADALSNHLVPLAGGYLRNIVRERFVTCAVCSTPVDGYEYCLTCKRHLNAGGLALADTVASLAYAIDGRQSGYTMYAYKAATPVRAAWQVVGLTTILGLLLHVECTGKLRGAPVTHWSTVPSLKGREGIHPIHQLVAPFAPGTEVPLTVASTEQPRELSASHYQLSQSVVGAHVLLVDDTWVSGGHAQSAALTLRNAGAAHVSLLTVARWLDPSFGNTDSFIRSKLQSPDYRPEICPWTGGSCP